MRYLHTMLRIADIEESLRFFDALGLEEVFRKESESGRFTLIFLAARDDVERAKETKAPLLELTYNWPDEKGEVEAYTGGRNFGHIAFQVDNIYEVCQQLQNKDVTINRPPRDGRMAFVRTPDGISVELLQKGESLPPAEPWSSMENIGSW